MDALETSQKEIKHKDYIMLWVCYFLMPINIYSEYLEKISGIETLVYNIGSFVILLVIAFPRIVKNRYFNRKIVYFSGGVIALVIIHIALFGNYVNELKQASFVAEFFIVSTLYNDCYFGAVKKMIIIVSLIMSLDVFVNLPTLIENNYNLFNVRRYTMLDKPYYTLILPIAIIFFSTSLLHPRSKHKKILILSVILIFCVVLFGIIGSKTALLAALIAVFVVMSRNDKRKKSLYIAVIGLGLFAFFYFVIFHKKAPDFIMSAVYFFRGQYDVLPYAYAKSYFVRFEIVKLAFRTFLSHPIIGCGFNNYYSFVSGRGWQLYSKGITDVESDALAIFSEGGLVYTFLVIWLIKFLLKTLFSRKDYLRNNEYHTLDALGCLICLVIAIMGNDFMSSFFWCMLGIIYGCVTKGEYS